VLNRGWLDRDEGAVPTYEQVVNDDVDAEEVEKTEEFEYKYNFRFEEPYDFYFLFFDWLLMLFLVA